MFKVASVTASTPEAFAAGQKAGELFCKYVWPYENSEIQVNLAPNIVGYDIKPSYPIYKPIYFRVFDGERGLPDGGERSKLDEFHLLLTEQYASITLNKVTFLFYYLSDSISAAQRKLATA